MKEEYDVPIIKFVFVVFITTQFTICHKQIYCPINYAAILNSLATKKFKSIQWLNLLPVQERASFSCILANIWRVELRKPDFA
jgi:hypothetical protein